MDKSEEQRQKALKEADRAYYDPTSKHYKDNERYSWAVTTINKMIEEKRTESVG